MFNFKGITIGEKTIEELINEAKTILSKYGIEDKPVKKVIYYDRLVELEQPAPLSLALVAGMEHPTLDHKLKTLNEKGKLNKENLDSICQNFFQYAK